MKDIDKILSKVADYIAATQPQIDEYNKNMATFNKRANQLAGMLVAKGILPRERMDAFLNKVASDKSGVCVWDLVEKLADAIGSDALGDHAEIKAAGSTLDPFERWVLYGDPRASAATPGMIE